MLLSENSVEMRDSAFLGKPRYDSYIETRIDYGIVSSIPDDDVSN